MNLTHTLLTALILMSAGCSRGPLGSESEIVAWKEQFTRGAGEAFSDCERCPEMVVLPKGRFQYGQPDTRYTPVAEGHIEYAFAIGRNEVTVADWRLCVAAQKCPNGSISRYSSETDAIVRISFEDANAFAAWLSSQVNEIYRLPSSSEWEYAARGGTTTMYHWGNELGLDNADCSNCGAEWKIPSAAQAGTVARFAANAFGLHDMHGNAYEYTRDCWSRDYASLPKDGSAHVDDSARVDMECDAIVIRGGSAGSDGVFLQSASRQQAKSDSSNNVQGFRLVREL